MNLRWVIAIGLFCLTIQSVNAQGVGADPGRIMYEKGLLPNGKSMTATIQGDIEISGQQIICTTCHRRSGMGSIEGSQVAPAITGNLLFKPLQLPTSKPPAPPVLRPAYTRDSLKRAITKGIRADGKPLGPIMPRYSLDDESLDVLFDYLDTLSKDWSPGISDDEIHFATIVSDSVDEKSKQALLNVMNTFFKQKNIETRNESGRAQNAPWHKEWIFKPYRKWVLHVWELHGPEETWPQQLAKRYTESPVFAVLSGVVNESWKPVHEFCEQNRVPCLFPTTDLPVVAKNDFYSLYMNRGMMLEGEGIAAHLKQGNAISGNVIQIYRKGDPRGLVAATSLRQALEPGEMDVTDLVLGQNEGELISSIQRLEGATVVVWGDEGLVVSIVDNLPNGVSPNRIYLSSTLHGTDVGKMPIELYESVFFIHTEELPNRLNRLIARSTGWFKAKRIYEPSAKRIQANAFFTLKVAGDALKHIRGYFYRDYFIERIEHLIDNAPYTSIYPRIGMAPGQRFVSKGFYIAKPVQVNGRGIEGVTEWLIP